MDVKKYLKGLMLLTWTFQQGETSILMIVCVSMKWLIKIENAPLAVLFCNYLLADLQLTAVKRY